MDRLFTAMAIFIEYPFIAAAIGSLLLGLGWWTRRRTVVVVGVIWLCSGECNIRIDLLVIYPLLLLALVAAAVSLFRPRRGQRRTA